MSVEVVTFGCRLNVYESEIIRREAHAAGLDDAVVVNTCAVTNEAVRQAKQSIRRIKRERPGRIVVTGCEAGGNELIRGNGEVDRVVGNEEKFDSRIWTASDKIVVSDIADSEDDAVSTPSTVSMAHAHSCRCKTVAITAVPSALFLMAVVIRSLSMDEVVAQARRLVGTAIAKSC